MCDLTINIYGGNNQILPNATEAVQNLYVYDHANKLQVVQTTSDALSSEVENSLATSTRTTFRSISTRFARVTTPPIWPRSSSLCSIKSPSSPKRPLSRRTSSNACFLSPSTSPREEA